MKGIELKLNDVGCFFYFVYRTKLDDIFSIEIQSFACADTLLMNTTFFVVSKYFILVLFG